MLSLTIYIAGIHYKNKSANQTVLYSEEVFVIFEYYAYPQEDYIEDIWIQKSALYTYVTLIFADAFKITK